MNPNYVVKKSMVASISIWLILFCWLIIPLIVQIARIVAARCYTIEFYDDRVVTRSGVLNKQEKQTVFAGVYAVTVNKSLFGSMFNYGDIAVDCPGVWDIDTKAISNPEGLKHYLEGKITSRGMTNIIYN